MGTIIKASFASPSGPPSSIGMAVFAAQNCLAEAGLPMQDIDLLINIGVFRDDNIVEPAMAPLIQKQLGLNLDPVRNGCLQRSTLSFDINDGECGFLTAVRVADTFFKSGSAKYALVVAGDIHPSKTHHPDFPFQSVACAIVLAHTEDADSGFSGFYFKTSENGSFGFSANVDLMANGLKSRECMNFMIEDQYHDRLSGFTSEWMREVFQSGRINPADIDYIVMSQQTKGFGEMIARSANMNGRSQVVDLYDQYGNAHTSSLILCYHHLVSGGLTKKNDRILFIAAGSGLSAACSLYVV
jgi:3-oxoacyl-[acyl-carrier-protein] synthase III